MLRSATDSHFVIEKESPWMQGRTVTICSGADMLLTRNAVEEAARAIIAAAPLASGRFLTGCCAIARDARG